MRYLSVMIGFFLAFSPIGCKGPSESDLRQGKSGAEAVPQQTAVASSSQPQASASPASTGGKTFEQLLELLPLLLTAGKINAANALKEKPDTKILIETIFNYLIDNIKRIVRENNPDAFAKELMNLIRPLFKPALTKEQEDKVMVSIVAGFKELQALKGQKPSLSALIKAASKIAESIPGESGELIRKYLSVEAIEAFLKKGETDDAFKNLLGLLSVGSTTELLNLLNSKPQ